MKAYSLLEEPHKTSLAEGDEARLDEVKIGEVELADEEIAKMLPDYDDDALMLHWTNASAPIARPDEAQ